MIFEYVCILLYIQKPSRTVWNSEAYWFHPKHHSFGPEVVRPNRKGKAVVACIPGANRNSKVAKSCLLEPFRAFGSRMAKHPLLHVQRRSVMCFEAEANSFCGQKRCRDLILRHCCLIMLVVIHITSICRLSQGTSCFSEGCPAESWTRSLWRCLWRSLWRSLWGCLCDWCGWWFGGTGGRICHGRCARMYRANAHMKGR